MEKFNGNEIELIVIEPMTKARGRDLSSEDNGFLFDLYKAEDCVIPEEKKPYLFKIIESKIASCFQYKIDNKAVVLLAYLSETPGRAMLYLWYLQYWAKKENIYNFDYNLIYYQVFPKIFPSNEDLDVIWKKQKIERKNVLDSDNLVDYLQAGKSLL